MGLTVWPELLEELLHWATIFPKTRLAKTVTNKFNLPDVSGGFVLESKQSFLVGLNKPAVWYSKDEKKWKTGQFRFFHTKGK